MSKKSNNSVLQFLLAVVGLLFAIVLIRFPFPANMIALLLMIGLVLGYYYYTVFMEKKRQKEYDATLLGKLDLQKENCKSKISTLQTEIKSIDSNIQELKSKLDSNPEASPQARRETEKVIAGFEEEKKLRHSKIDFYKLCESKLNQIFKNHQLTEDLKSKREKLEALKETNIDEVAEMEGMKTYIDYEQEYIETIDTLSLKMLDSRSIENTEVLKLELVEMTKELREL